MGIAALHPSYAFGFLPDGQITSHSDCGVSSPSDKNISVFPKCKSRYMICRPVPKEGRHAIVTAAGRDAVDADVTTDERD